MADPFAPSGNVILDDTSTAKEPTVPPPDVMTQVPPPSPSSPTSIPVQEAPFVIPTPSENTNPFVPNIPNAPMSVSRGPGSPLPKRILMIGAFVVLLTLVILAGKFVLGFIGGASTVTLQYWGLWENDATMQSVITQFETAHPKVKIVYTKQSPRQYRERLQSAIERGDGPDIYRFHNTWVPMLRSQLAPATSDIMTTSEFASAFYPVASADLV
jgi:hypothetical protein